MRNRYSFLLILGIVVGVTALTLFLASGHIFSVAQPRGIIAAHEYNLVKIAVALMVLVIVPVYGLTILFVWRYRANNTKATYTPNWEHNNFDELIWWAVPAAIILVLAIITWTSTHALNPYKPLNNKHDSLVIQVVSLEWQWLFIYPQQHLALTNQLVIPTNTPVTFELTSDAPMNSLWIPQLSGQIMTMPGMTTVLNIEANAPGTYTGRSANFSGAGFANMVFPVHATSSTAFTAWAARAQQTATTTLSLNRFYQLAQPTQNAPARTFKCTDTHLYNEIEMQFMNPADGAHIPRAPKVTGAHP